MHSGLTALGQAGEGLANANLQRNVARVLIDNISQRWDTVLVEHYLWILFCCSCCETENE
jgi:hypothetical protein